MPPLTSTAFTLLCGDSAGRPSRRTCRGSSVPGGCGGRHAEPGAAPVPRLAAHGSACVEGAPSFASRVARPKAETVLPASRAAGPRLEDGRRPASWTRDLAPLRPRVRGRCPQLGKAPASDDARVRGSGLVVPHRAQRVDSVNPAARRLRRVWVHTRAPCCGATPLHWPAPRDRRRTRSAGAASRRERRARARRRADGGAPSAPATAAPSNDLWATTRRNRRTRRPGEALVSGSGQDPRV
jgi:hypothetical protein